MASHPSILGKATGRLWNRALARGMPSGALLLYADVPGQRLYLIRNHEVIREYVISTSRFGLGEHSDTHQTPAGWHEVAERFGEGEPAGRVFRSRIPTQQVISKEHWNGEDTGDLILSRILRLGGLENGRNRGGSCDTYQRYIYIHGTNHEHLLGEPVSHGCIRMANAEIIELFDLLRHRPAWCWIGSAEDIGRMDGPDPTTR